MEPEFGKQVLDVSSSCLRADKEAFRDRLVVSAHGELKEDLALPGGQSGEASKVVVALLSISHHLLHEHAQHLLRDVSPVARDGLRGLNEVLERTGLGQIAGGAGQEGLDEH